MIKFSIIVLFVFSLSLHSEELLSWEKDKLTYSAKLGEEGVLFTFKFKNRTAKELEVEKIKSSCSCMSVKTKFPFKVNSATEGTVEAYYDFTGKIGLNRGNIEVICNGKRVALSVEVDIPVPVTIGPRFLIWKKGERETKEIEVTLHPDWKGKITDVKPSIDGMETSMEKVSSGYLIKVSPPSVEKLKKKRTWLLLNGVDEKGLSKEYRIYLILN